MIKIRNLKKEDAPRVSELIKQLTLNIVEPDQLISRIEVMSIPKNYQYLVVKKEEQIVGFAGLAWYPIPSKGLMGWIEEVVVDEPQRGQGIGQALMEHLLQLATDRGLKQIKLTTNNPTAKHIYEKFGFTTKDESLLVKKYYQL